MNIVHFVNSYIYHKFLKLLEFWLHKYILLCSQDSKSKRRDGKMRVLLMVFAMACSLLMAEASFAGDRINVNTASAKQLQEATGIGEKTAKAIIQYRKSHGKFTKFAELKNVKGIGDKKLKKLKSSLKLSGSSSMGKADKKKGKKDKAEHDKKDKKKKMKDHDKNKKSKKDKKKKDNKKKDKKKSKKDKK